MSEEGVIEPESFEEKVVWYSITYTWVFYLLGALYVLAPAIGWVLVVWIGWKAYTRTPETLPRDRIRIPFGVWVWTVAMLVMLLALIVGHIGYSLGAAQTLKSTMGWVKGWALMAVFVAIGGCLDIRPQVLYRAANRLALQTVILVPLFLVSPIAHLPGHLYVSPLQALGGPGPDFFEVQLWGREPDGGARWRFWAPWAPAAGFVANVNMILGMQDRSRGWRTCGVLSAVSICLMSASRLALINILVTPAITFALARLSRPATFLFAATLTAIGGLTAQQILDLIGVMKQRFDGARAASSRVRATLGRIAFQRWKDEAPVFGHGIVERGPHLVEYMPIGSHHTWYGLLYVKGMVGFGALGAAMVCSSVELVAKAQGSRTARAALSILITLWMYTFGENLEILVYLFWPGLILMGFAFRQPLKAVSRADAPAARLAAMRPLMEVPAAPAS